MSETINNYFTDDDDYIDIFEESEKTIKTLSNDKNERETKEQPRTHNRRSPSSNSDIYSDSTHSRKSNEYYYDDEDSEYDENGVDDDEYYEDYTPVWFKIIMIVLYTIILTFAFIGILAVCLPNVRGAFFG